MNIKHLLNGVAIAAALAIAAPVWAQTAGGDTYGGNSMGLPGPNPGGPDVPSPYDAPGGAYYQVPPRPIPPSTSATPAHHAIRHASARYAHHKAMVQKAALTGDTTAQLNREELARIQSGTRQHCHPKRRCQLRCRLNRTRVAETAWEYPVRTRADQA